jgi:type I restriction enzyme, S subunit
MSKIDELIEGLCPRGVSTRDLGTLCRIETGKRDANEGTPDGQFLFFTTARQTSRIDSYRWDCEALLVAGNANVGNVKHFAGKFDAYQRTYVLSNFQQGLSAKYLFYALQNNLNYYLDSNKNVAAMTYIVLDTLKAFRVPVPPLEVQREIVSILDKFTQLEAELEARKIQYEVTRDRLLDFEGDLAGHPLQERISGTDLENIRSFRLADLVTTLTPAGKIARSKFQDEGVFPIVDQSQALIAGYTDDEWLVNDLEPCVVFGDHTREIKYVDFPFAAGADGTVILLPTGELSARFLFYSLQALRIQSRGYNRHWSVVKELQISIPLQQVQSQIVAILDKLDALVNDISFGLPAEIAARRKQYEHYRDELLTFKELDAA